MVSLVQVVVSSRRQRIIRNSCDCSNSNGITLVLMLVVVEIVIVFVVFMAPVLVALAVGVIIRGADLGSSSKYNSPASVSRTSCSSSAAAGQNTAGRFYEAT